MASGTEIFDWRVPLEWEVREAYVKGPDGKRIADVKQHNLHLVGYSQPHRCAMSLHDLKAFIHTRPDLPDAIPYVTSYYEKRWGFCMKHRDMLALTEGDYEVVVDTEFRKGGVQVGEAVLKGTTSETILLSSYLCHPSMANNELAGPLTLACLYLLIQEKPIEHCPFTLRFILHPETIGALCYLHLRKDILMNNVVGGCVVSCVGLQNPLVVKRARCPASDFERCLSLLALKHGGSIVEWSPFGSDERQFCSPGCDWPINLISRTIDFAYPEYHTSLDDENIFSVEKIIETAETIYQAIKYTGKNRTLKNTVAYGEPFLSKRNLYPSVSKGHAADIGLDEKQKAYVWLLSLCDGTRDLLDVAARGGLSIPCTFAAAEDLEHAGLLLPCT